MNYQNPYYQYQMPLQNMIQQPVQSQQTQIQNGGFISVRSIDEARNYPVAPGNSVTFKIEGQLFVCEKTLGYSQFDAPLFKVFKLVETDGSEVVTPSTTPLSSDYVLKSELDDLYKQIKDLQDQIETLKEPSKPVSKVGRKRKEDSEDVAE